MKIRVYYDSTDAGGIVYHTEYIKFCEQARSEIFFSNNIFFEKSEGYVIKNLNATYIKPAKLGDMIEIKTYILDIKKASLKIHQEIYKKNEKIFEIDLNIAYLKNSKISKIPDHHLKLLNEYKI